MLQVRFLRRDHTSVFLDSRDLIRLVERSQPVSVATFAEMLKKRKGRIVLIYTNVAEVIPQNDVTRADPAYVMSFLDELERMPHIYMRTFDLAHDEFREAVRAFQGNGRVIPIDPFVNHWWETAWITPPWIARRIDRPEVLLFRDRMSLAEQVVGLLDDPKQLRFEKRHETALSKVLAADRIALGTSRGTREVFEMAVARRLDSFGWPEPRGGIRAFAQYIRVTPGACPGWRAGFDVWEEFRCDHGAKSKVNDIRDMTHVEILPYVAHATLDRAWRSRCKQARDRLAHKNLWCEPFDRVCKDLEQIITRWEL